MMLARVPKYRNQRTVGSDGFTYASKAEARRGAQLELLVRGGVIVDLVRQPRFDIAVNGVHITRYVGDFQYTEAKTGKRVLEDVKGVETPAFKIKRTLMKAVFEIDVVLVR